MRLVDADALEKDANEDLLSDPDTVEEVYWNDGAKSIIDLIKTAPTIDAVPVVRCKDCKWWGFSEYNAFDIHICKMFSGMRECDFCSRAEKSEE